MDRPPIDPAPTLPELATRARLAFASAYGAHPAWVAAAPGRVNLIGEHTDYNDGLVLPVALDRWCVIAGSPAADPAVSRVVSRGIGATAELDFRGAIDAVTGGPVDRSRVVRGSWESYVAGVGDLMRRGTGGAGPRIAANIDAVIESSVPAGGGLSSSAALEVAFATLLEAAWRVTLAPAAKAALCQAAEHRFAGVPCGIMDQTAAVYGRAGHALLLDCRDGRVDHIPLPPPGSAELLVVNTGVRHSLAAGQYAVLRSHCEQAAARLGLRSLRDATPGSADHPGLTDPERRAVRHVVSEIARTAEAARALAEGDAARFGELMFASHASLRDDYRVSCPELDAVVELARGEPGCLGARLTGGGFGGCAVVLARPGAGGRIAAVLAEKYPALAGRRATVWRARAVDGAGLVGAALVGA